MSQLNQLDSHDTMRFLTMVNGDEQIFRNALMFLFCWPGVPCIYYGTEVSLEGGHDPDNRRCFPWERLEQHREMVGFIKTLTALRQHSKAVQQGSIQWLHAEGDILAFARVLDGDVVICAVNRGEKPVSFVLPVWKTGVEMGAFTSVMGDDKLIAGNGNMQLALAEKSALILKRVCSAD